MSTQRAQGVLLFLVRFNKSARFEIYGVTRSSSSRPFLCALGIIYDMIMPLLLPIDSMLDYGLCTVKTGNTVKFDIKLLC